MSVGSVVNSDFPTMIKVFIKHHIYERCINVLFNTISRNFVRPKPDRFKIGEFWRQIEYYYSNKQYPIYYHNCTILEQRTTTTITIQYEYAEIFSYEENKWYSIGSSKSVIDIEGIVDD